MGVGEVRVGGQVGLGVQQQLGDGRELRAEHVGDHVDVVAGGVGGGLGEDGADGRGDHLRVALADPGQGVAHEVDPAPLPAGAGEHCRCGVGEAAVAVADDQLDAREAAVTQPAQEVRPERRPRKRGYTQVSLSRTSQPSTSRLGVPPRSGGSSVETPVAMTTAWDTTQWVMRALQYVASRNT